MKTVLQVVSDWATAGTAEQLEEKIGNGFKFKGPGLYIRAGEFDLIVPADPSDHPFAHMENWPEDQLWYFHHWDCDIEQSVFGPQHPVVREYRQ